uniref:Clathrin light chain n=1 Tax=Entomoneis paludosa TaxID=265537 RepID=A0A7S2YG92_9STRA
MADDNVEVMFAGPPATDDNPVAGDAPIILGEPAGDFASPPAGDFAMPEGSDFAAPPAEGTDPQYLGDVSEAAPADAPIVLGMDDAPPAEPAGPSPMQKWNEEWQETLKQRKEAENECKAKYVEEARIEMEKFNAERELKRQGKMTKNREDEQAKLEAIEADLENDNSWQRVCKLVELNMDGDKGGDMKRMIDTLIALKNDPAHAATLA